MLFCIHHHRLALSAWSHSVQKLGCFSLARNPAVFFKSNAMTYEKCWTFCSKNDLEISWLFDGELCGCTKTIQLKDLSTDTGCSRKCSGHNEQTCGGSTSSLLFHVSASPCDYGWVHHQYSGSCYKFVQRRLDWESAAAVCKEYSSSLVKIDSKYEQYFLDKYIFYNYEDQWIGAAFQNVTNVYLWQDSSHLYYQRWFRLSVPRRTDGWCAFIYKNVYWKGYNLNSFLWETEMCNATKQFICEKTARQCPDIPTVPHATRDISNKGLGSKVYFLCNDGYESPDHNSSVSITCQIEDLNSQNVNWTYNDLSCLPVKCPTLQHIRNALLSTTDTSFKNSVYISCKRGYIFPTGDKKHTTVTCQANKTWTKMPQSCERIRCPKLSNTYNRFVDSENNTYESIVKLNCKHGFMFPDRSFNKTIKCMANRKWTDSSTDCVVSECLSLDNGRRLLSTTNVTHSTIVNVECKHGYKFTENSTSHTMECLGHGTWNTTLPVCAPVPCSPIPEGVITENNETRSHFGITLTALCPEGLEFLYRVTKFTTSCDALGHWVPDLLSCEEIIDIKAMRQLPPREAPAAEFVGTSAIGMLTGAVLFIIVLDAPTLYIHCKMFRKNSKQMKRNIKRYVKKQFKKPRYSYGIYGR